MPTTCNAYTFETVLHCLNLHAVRCINLYLQLGPCISHMLKLSPTYLHLEYVHLAPSFLTPLLRAVL